MLNFRLLSISLIFFIVSITVRAQNFDKLDIPITRNGKTLLMPYTGGMKAPQFSNIDFNGDGILDLFVFDRNGDQILPFVKTGNKGSLDYRFAPEYIEQFPKLNSWALLKDYNKDGILDIFASSVIPASTEVWKGRKNTDGRITYQKLNFNYGPFREILQFPINDNTSFTNVYTSNIDLPAIVDADGDGDIDMITFEPGGSFAQLYKNLSVEENLGVDSLKYIREDACWGKFSENQFNDLIKLSTSINSCAESFTGDGNSGARHTGSTLTVFDTNGDELLDLVIGDIGSNKMKKLTNGGTKQNAFMTELEENFPANDVSAFLDYFLAAYNVDADGDGIRDLIIAPNEINSAENNNHIWLYRNTGTNAMPIFKLVKKNFLIDEMAYFFSGSHPAFTDVNADGLMDVVIGTAGERKKDNIIINKMILLLNTGTSENPQYNIADEDYLNFSKYTAVSTGRFAPTFGDLDADGDLDLLVGDAVGLLYYSRNTAGPNKPFSFSDPIYAYSDIFVGQNAKPQIIDLDGDGLLDLVIGKKNNELNFYKNIGSMNNPFFDPNPDNSPNIRQLGKIFVGNDPSTQNGAPYFITSDNKKMLMLMGTDNAQIKAYDNVSVNGTFNLLYNQTGNINQGRRVVPSLADIDEDGFYEMAVGNERGGLSFYNTNFKTDTTSSALEEIISEVVLFPNPTHRQIYVRIDNYDAEIMLMDIQGRAVKTLTNLTVNDISDIHPGLYFVRVNAGKTSYVRKVVVME